MPGAWRIFRFFLVLIVRDFSFDLLSVFSHAICTVGVLDVAFAFIAYDEVKVIYQYVLIFMPVRFMSKECTSDD